ncbi:MAG: SDR family NAD(P)-dependent oxidoreductase [Bacteroidales bacterium]
MNILVTGGTSGLGYELVLKLLGNGHNVTAIGRTLKKIPVSQSNFNFVKADFSDLHATTLAINGLMNQNPGYDVIINNAGVLSPQSFTLTTDGLEHSFQVNFLANMLTDILVISQSSDNKPVRVISITSPVWRHVRPSFRLPDPGRYRMFRVYSETKYYQVISGYLLNRLLPGKTVIFAAFDPGTFRSGISRMQKKWFRMLYKIASPLMTDPSEIAGVLAHLACTDPFPEGTVVNRKGRKKDDIVLPSATILNDFSGLCNGLLTRYT